jgi:hypothetical protein
MRKQVKIFKKNANLLILKEIGIQWNTSEVRTLLKGFESEVAGEITGALLEAAEGVWVQPPHHASELKLVQEQ